MRPLDLGRRSASRSRRVQTLMVLAVVVAAAGILVLRPRAPVSQAALSPDGWRADLARLADRLREEHPFLFARLSPDAFERRVRDIHRRIPELDDDQVAVELARITASVRDGHTELDLRQRAVGLRRLPLNLYVFGHDLYVVSAAPAYRAALGRQVISLSGVAVSDALDAVKDVISIDNEMEYLHSGPLYLAYPGILRGLGIVTEGDGASLELAAVDGDTLRLEVRAVPVDSLATEAWVSLTSESGNTLPLYRTRPDESYWYRYLEDSRTVYLQYNRVQDQRGGPSIRRFSRDLFRFIDANPVDRLVVDLRFNSGGNFHKSEPLITGIVQRPALNRRGRVFVITSRRTFSAATMTALLLEQRTEALVVGERSRGSPNGSYNAERLTLPNSRIQVWYTNRAHTPAPELGDRRYLPVDHAIPLTVEDYRTGRDPVMEWILGGGGR